MSSGVLLGRRTVGIVGLVALLAALAAAAWFTQASPRTASAADHLDAPGLTPPPGGDGIGTDLTDIYAFRSKTNPNNTVLIMNVNGLASPAGIGNGPGPDRAFGTSLPEVGGDKPVTYNFRVDSDGDAVEDVTIQIAFGGPKKDGAQKFDVNVVGNGKKGHKDKVDLQGWSTGFGEKARINEEHGITAFAGRRDDPFFFDLVGFLGILTGQPRSLLGCGSPNAHPERDTFLGQNVSSIVLEVPSDLLTDGGDSNIGVWATTNVGDDQIDRMGRPAINTVFIPNNPFPPDRVSDGKMSKKTTFNHGSPATDVADWNGEVVDTLNFRSASTIPSTAARTIRQTTPGRSPASPGSCCRTSSRSTRRTRTASSTAANPQTTSSTPSSVSSRKARSRPTASARTTRRSRIRSRTWRILTEHSPTSGEQVEKEGGGASRPPFC